MLEEKDIQELRAEGVIVEVTPEEVELDPETGLPLRIGKHPNMMLAFAKHELAQRELDERHAQIITELGYEAEKED